MSSTPKTYGYSRKGSVPALEGTHAKLCPQCKLWFAAYPRQRVCYKDSAPERRRELDKRQVTELGHTRTPKRKITYRFSRSELRKMALKSAIYDLTGETPPKDFASLPHNGVSFGCSHPKDQQADHLSTARRHPYGGSRPNESGWCYGPCNCPCHVQSYTAARDDSKLVTV